MVVVLVEKRVVSGEKEGVWMGGIFVTYLF